MNFLWLECERETQDKKNLIGMYIHVRSSFLVVLFKDSFRIESFYALNMGKKQKIRD
jgi:hypothetical protein